MKKFLSKLLLFLLPVAVVFVVAFFLTRQLLNSQSDYSLPQHIQAVFVGHSQPEAAFNDSLIPGTRNLCNGGEAYLYTAKKLELVLNHNPQLKTVFISFSNNQIDRRMNDWTYGDKYLDNYFLKYNFRMSSLDYQEAFAANAMGTLRTAFKSVVHNAKTIVKSKNPYADNNMGGYLYLKRFKTDSLLKHHYIDQLKKEMNDSISEINLRNLDNIVRLCKEKNVKLYFVRTPIHPILFAAYDEKRFQHIRTSRYPTIPFLDFHDFKVSNGDFGDFEHLNFRGAKLFSDYFQKQRATNFTLMVKN